MSRRRGQQCRPKGRNGKPSSLPRGELLNITLHGRGHPGHGRHRYSFPPPKPGSQLNSVDSSVITEFDRFGIRHRPRKPRRPFRPRYDASSTRWPSTTRHTNTLFTVAEVSCHHEAVERGGKAWRESG